MKLCDEETDELLAIYCTNLTQAHTFRMNGEEFTSAKLANCILSAQDLDKKVLCPRKRIRRSGKIFSWGYHFCTSYATVMQSPWNLATEQTRQFDDFIKSYAQDYVLECYRALAPTILKHHQHKTSAVKTVLGNTPFTTCTLNLNTSYVPHKDARDIQGKCEICVCAFSLARRRFFSDQLLSLLSANWRLDILARISMRFPHEQRECAFAESIQSAAWCISDILEIKRRLSNKYCLLHRIDWINFIELTNNISIECFLANTTTDC
jgi:hypothetical protein